jgi:hypothetical protein
MFLFLRRPSILADGRKRQAPLVDFYHLFGYMSGLLFIKPDMDATSLFRTASLVHVLDAVLCRVIAGHNHRQKDLWTLLGLVFGIWALGTLFLLPAKSRGANGD